MPARHICNGAKNHKEKFEDNVLIQLQKEFQGHAPGQTIGVRDEDARVLVQEGTAVPVDAEAVIGPAVDQVVGVLSSRLNGAVDAALQEFARKQTQARKNAVPALFGSGGDGDPRGRSLGDWLLAVRRHDAAYLADKYDSHWAERGGQKSAMHTGTGTQGGFTVPVELLPRLMSVAAESAVVRPRATIVPMASRTVQIPTLDATSVPGAGESALFGGLVARWTEEAAPLNETEPAFKQLELKAHELSGYSKVSNTLLEDNAIGLEAVLVNLIGRAIGWFEDMAFLRGDGVGKPLGILQSNAFITAARSTAGAFGLAEAAGMLGRLLPGWNARHAVWAMHPSVLVKLIAMVGGGTGSDVVYIDNAREKVPMSLFGIPVVTTEKLPALNTPGDVLLLDLQHYLIGDRREVEITYSEHAAFLSNQGTWRFVARVDGQPWIRDKITLADGTSTLSPFVGLAAG